MKIHQWEVWKTRPPRFESDHWFVVASGEERCGEQRPRMVNGLACFTLRGALAKTDVLLDSADGLACPAACQCDFLYQIEKSKQHSAQGFVSWERQQLIKSKLREVLRL